MLVSETSFSKSGFHLKARLFFGNEHLLAVPLKTWLIAFIPEKVPHPQVQTTRVGLSTVHSSTKEAAAEEPTTQSQKCPK